MAARQSAECTAALALVARGMTAYAAAKQTGIALSTIYRAIQRHSPPRTSGNRNSNRKGRK